MEKELLFVIFLAFFVATACRECKLCQFEKQFPDVASCRRWQNGTQRPDTTPSLVTNSSTSGNSSTLSDAGCYLLSEQVFILNGSSLVNGDCTQKFTCINGVIEVNIGYRCGSNAMCESRDNFRQCYCNSGYYGDGESCVLYRPNCQDFFANGSTNNGIYTIKPNNWDGLAFPVFCDMNNGGGWTVFQRRVDDSVSFYRDWASYKDGFGELDGGFWLGNDKLHHLTNQENNQLRIDLVNVNGGAYYAEYDSFRINDEADNYRLSRVGSYSGNAGDSLSYDLNYPFTTLDRDNDPNPSTNCADDRRGGWWYWTCTWANLNGDFNGPSDYFTIYWKDLPVSWFNIKYVEMKIRPL